MSSKAADWNYLKLNRSRVRMNFSGYEIHSFISICIKFLKSSKIEISNLMES
jgi:hypothetical protein